jgi:hypothetical protein
MARTLLGSVTTDLVTDAGAVLWSLIKGEQLEFPVTLDFLENASSGYTYEAVVIEAHNIIDQEEPPLVVLTGGVKTSLIVRVLVDRGTWDSAQAYNREEFVKYNDLYYKKISGVAQVEAVTPDLSSTWTTHNPNIVYIQFPSSLINSWTVQPGVKYGSYGFFELRVTEPADPIFVRTWKPLRGMVLVQFSPTDEVP